MSELWPTTEVIRPLGAQDIHVWCMSLECTESELVTHRRLLSDDERRRADKFLFDRHRRRFAVGRSSLRQILSNYVDVLAADIQFAYSGLGKPRLVGSEVGHGLCFNFSNSHERALLAIAKDVEIGVDIERVRSRDSLDGLAERFFAPTEKQYILGQSDPERTTSFFHCWTRKEAFLKAIGKGLTFPLRDVTVELVPEATVRILQINDAFERAPEWMLDNLVVEPDYVAALACRRHGNRVVRYRFC
jgi:4'-phosphopantetheinyl transferase